MADSHREDARPAFQFYPKDWLSDTELGMCSLATKGLWIDLLCLMWNAPVRGVLMYSPDGTCHSKLDGKRLAKTLRCHEQEVAEGIAELLENGVASVDEDGFLYSRRMRRGGKLGEIRSEAGKKGAEKRWNSEQKMANADFAIAKSMANDGPSSAFASSSSSSSASSSSTPTPKREDPIPPVGGDGCPLQSFPDVSEAYPEIRRLIVEAHPRAKLPDLGTVKELEDRKILNQIIRLDGHTPVEVVLVTKWVLTEEVPSNGFSWRDQFQSIAGLRNKKTGDTLTKFAKMCESHARAQGRPHNGGARHLQGVPVYDPLTPERQASIDEVYESVQRQSDARLEKIREELKAKQEPSQ